MHYLIYFIYNGDGRIDDYIPPFLAQMRTRYDFIHVVFNGTLAEGEAEKLGPVADKIQERGNVEFDVGAYKAALFSNPDEFYTGLNELTLANFTFFAPIGGLADYFAWSDGQDVDFWGISAHKSMTPNPFTNEGELPYHIQSHWISVGPKILKSPEFLAYWRNLPEIKSYMDSVLHHESQFTQHFSGLGYKYGVYLDDSTYHSDYPAFNEIERAVKEGFPLLKRRLFYHVPAYLDRYEVNLRGALEHIEKNALYDSGLIWRSVAGSVDPGVLYQNADLLYIVPDQSAMADAPGALPRVVLLATEEFSNAQITATVRRIGFDCRLTLLAPSSRFADAFTAAAEENEQIVAVDAHVQDGFPECFTLLTSLLGDTDPDEALLFATLSTQDLGQFQYGLEHLALDSNVASGAKARLQNASSFGLALPPPRCFGDSPDTSALTEETRFELQNDLNSLGLNQSLEDHVLYSTAGVIWIRSGLLAKIAGHLSRFANEGPIFEEFGGAEGNGKDRIQISDGKELDSFLTVGLPFFASKNGYGTFILSNTAALPRNFVKLEARYRRFAERLGTGDPFEMASHADYLMRFSSQEDRETIFSEVHRSAYEKGWANAIDTVWKQAVSKGREELAQELSTQIAGDPGIAEAAGENDAAAIRDAVRDKLFKDGFDKGFNDGWKRGADEAFREGFRQGSAGTNLLQRGARVMRRITGRSGSGK